MEKRLLKPSTRMATSLIGRILNHVGEDLFHVPEVEGSGYEYQDRGYCGGEHHQTRRRVRAEQGPAKSFDHADHRIKAVNRARSEEHTSELQSRFGISYA